MLTSVGQSEGRVDLPETKPYRLIVFVSGGGTNLQTIIDRIADGSLPSVEIVQVISSRQDAYALQRAKQHNLPHCVFNPRDFAELESWENALLAKILPLQPDLLVLAGYLSKIGPRLIRAFPHRIINVHPALIPKYCGKGYYGIKPHQAVLANGDTKTGATVHYVDEGYDTGAIIMQREVPVLPEDTAETLQLRVMQHAEQIILPQAIRQLQCADRPNVGKY